MSYHEAHITLDVKDRAVAERLGAKYGFHWSQIDGDEEMGPGVKAYLTKSQENGITLSSEMNTLCAELNFGGVKWQRRKIEQIILDERAPTEP